MSRKRLTTKPWLRTTNDPRPTNKAIRCPHHRHLVDGGVGGGRRKNQSKPWAVWDWAVVMTTINLLAKKLNMSKQAISKALIKVAKETGITFLFQRSDGVRKIYSIRAKKHHRRLKKEVPKFDISSIKRSICP